MCGCHPQCPTCPLLNKMETTHYKVQEQQSLFYTTCEHNDKLPSLKIKIKAFRPKEKEKDEREEGQQNKAKKKRFEIEENDEHLKCQELIDKYKATWDYDCSLKGEDVVHCNLLGYKVTQPYPSSNKDKPKPTNLHPKASSVLVTNKRDAFGPELLAFCLKNPICVIRDLAPVCGMNLGLYSSKTLTETWPNHEVEIRTQYFKNEDQNVDLSGRESWDCYSVRSQSSTIRSYADYQAKTFSEYLEEKNGKKKRSDGGSDSELDYFEDEVALVQKKFFGLQQLKFGTNVDLSDEVKWKPQLDELNKLPAPFKVFSPGNMLSHVGHQILGMNTVQLYMKVKGSRTPGHQENNNFSAVNMNIGPGNCEWFAVADEYWEDMYHLCKRNGLDYLKGSWWPDLTDCEKAGIPVHRFIQRPGDLVFINIGCVHWVQSLGWCNNIAWNVGPLTAIQYKMALERYEFNKLEQFKSIVPMMSLSWNIARNIIIKDPELFRLIKSVLRRTLLHSVKIIKFVKNLGRRVLYHGKSETDNTNHCELCEEEVFNTLIVSSQGYEHVKVFCIRCALQASPDLSGYMCLKEFKMRQLKAVYDNFTLGG